MDFEFFALLYAPFDTWKMKELQTEVDAINDIIARLDPAFAVLMHHSLSTYAEHVKHADHSVLEDFLFPIPIHGITER